MKRREFVQKLGVGSAAAMMTGGVVLSSSRPLEELTPGKEGHGHSHEPVRGPNATATVAFGSWRSDVPLDRFPNVSPAAANAHLVIPYQVTIKSGGTVAFAVSGFHQVLVYGPDIKPDQVNATLTRPSTGMPAGALLINDQANRVYAGLDPSTQPRDRIEVVQFQAVGRYLVICGVQPHFVNDQMFGWVRVRPDDESEN